MYSTGIPDCWMRRSGAFVIVHQGELTTFSLSSQLLDVRLVFAPNSKEKISAVLLLCEHELVAIDLMDPQLRCVNLNCLRCIDSSPVTTIRVEQLEADDPLFSAPCSQYSRRRRLFERRRRSSDAIAGQRGVHGSRERRHLHLGHAGRESAAAANLPGGQLHCDSEQRRRERRRAGRGAERRGIRGSLHGSRVRERRRMSGRSTRTWPPARSPSGERIPRDCGGTRKSRKSVEVGVYDDRSEDDRLAVESFHYCPRRQTLVCGLHGGMVIAATASNSECDFAHENIDEIKTVEVRQSEIEQTNALQSPLQYKKPNRMDYLDLHPASLPIDHPAANSRPLCFVLREELRDDCGHVDRHRGLQFDERADSVREKLLVARRHRSGAGGREAVDSTEDHEADDEEDVPQAVDSDVTNRPASGAAGGIPGLANAREQRSSLHSLPQHAEQQAALLRGDGECDGLRLRTGHRRLLLVDQRNPPLASRAHHFDRHREGRTTDSCDRVHRGANSLLLAGGHRRPPAEVQLQLTAKCGIQLRRACVFRSTENSYDYLGMLCNDGNVLAISANDPRVRVHERFTAADNSLAIRTSAINEASEFAFVGANSCTLTMASCNPTRTESSWRTNASSSVPFDL
ncbi:hypothetical protein M3Y99_00329200 [Aphelenchoides fujianensis]|nr:hypothetical protein M3Y99_00329200 [Aphelenchoides fujianensis]